MNWVIADQNTLKELETGFAVKLVEGTWFHPRHIYPVSPPHLDFLTQARLLRLGLEYVNSLGNSRMAS